MAVFKYKSDFIPYYTEARLANTLTRSEQLAARVRACLDETRVLIATAREIVEESRERRRQRGRTPAA